MDSFYLYFNGDGRCVLEFLAANGFAGKEGSKRRGLPFVPTFGEEYGWPQGEEKEFDILRDTISGTSVDVLIAIDNNTTPRHVYLRAMIV